MPSRVDTAVRIPVTGRALRRLSPAATPRPGTGGSLANPYEKTENRSAWPMIQPDVVDLSSEVDAVEVSSELCEPDRARRRKPGMAAPEPTRRLL